MEKFNFDGIIQKDNKEIDAEKNKQEQRLRDLEHLANTIEDLNPREIKLLEMYGSGIPDEEIQRELGYEGNDPAFDALVHKVGFKIAEAREAENS